MNHPDPGKKTDSGTKDDSKYEAVETAVLETKVGRWFLSEYARRNRTADTTILLDAIQKFQPQKQQQTQNDSTRLEVLRQELQEMSALIARTRLEVGALKPEDPDGDYINTATEELDAIAAATENATFEILNAAEKLQETGEKLREGNADQALCADIETYAANIFMACSFQDITGQRTTKVINALKSLEERISSMIAIWEEGHEKELNPQPLKEKDNRPDAHLLNGPAKNNEGVSQEDIDAMLSNPVIEVECD